MKMDCSSKYVVELVGDKIYFGHEMNNCVLRGHKILFGVIFKLFLAKFRAKTRKFIFRYFFNQKKKHF